MATHAHDTSILERYLALGLSFDRHVDGFVDAYYGPAHLRDRSAVGAPVEPARLLAEARALLGALDGGEPIGVVANEHGAPLDGEAAAESPGRRAWLRAQVLGLLMSARLLSGEPIAYADEVEACYGVRPHRFPEEAILDAHRVLASVVPGTGPLADRLVSWREAQAVPPDRLEKAVRSLAEDLRERTDTLFGLPHGERIEWVFETDKPWSGFNYYLGDLASRVAINVDLPVLSTSLAHLVAHEAYPGHHTEHSRKEVGVVRRRRMLEESIFLVGTPQCLVSEGLADLGLEVVLGTHPESVVASHLRPLGIAYDADTVAVVTAAGEALGGVRANAAFRLHEDGADPEVVIDEVARLGLQSGERAAKAVSFLLDPTWRSYISCYVEGLPLCRRYVSGRPERFERLITEPMTPAELASAT